MGRNVDKQISIPFVTKLKNKYQFDSNIVIVILYVFTSFDIGDSIRLFFPGKEIHMTHFFTSTICVVLILGRCLIAD